MVTSIRKQAVIFGNTKARYHPLSPMAGRMKEVLGRTWRLDVVDCGEPLNRYRLDNCALCIAFCEFGDRLREKELSALINYCEKGGLLLILHNGISLEEQFLETLNTHVLGVSFQGHPPYENLPCLAFHRCKDLPETGAKADFVLFDEAYRFCFEQPQETKPFLWYTDTEGVHPAGWERPIGKGRYIYLMPGHKESVYREARLAEILRKRIDA